jgi:hypothetical protein
MPGLPFQGLPTVVLREGTTMPLSTWTGPKQTPYQPTGQYRTSSTQQGQSNPISKIEDEVAFGQQQINRQFDQAKHELDVRTYTKPEEYIQAINDLKQQVAHAGLQLRQKAEAKLFSMQQIMKLVDEKIMPSQSGQKAMWRIAGLDEDQINDMLPETKPRNLMQEHAAIVEEQNRLSKILDEFAPDSKGVLYPSMDPKKDSHTPDTSQEPVSPKDVETYLMAQRLYDYTGEKETQLFEEMSPGLRMAVAGQRVAAQRVKPTGIQKISGWIGRHPYIFAGPVGGTMIHQLSKHSEQSVVGQTTGQKLDTQTAKQILSETGGDKEKARQIAQSRGYTF